MATKNLEKYFQRAPVADLTELQTISTIGRVNGLIIEVATDGSFELQMPAVDTPDGRDVIAGNGGGNWIRRTLPILRTTVSGAMAIASGGTGGITQQTALNSIAGAITDKYYLRGNGANVSMSAIQAADVPTLNQSTTGTASNITGVAAIANGGTGQTTQQAALNSIAGSVTSGSYLRGNGTNVIMSGIQVADVPTLNQSTTGTAAKATNIAGGATNKIPYQTNVDTTGFINAAANSVFVTDGSNVPSLSTTLPTGAAAGLCVCTDPTTSGSASINAALANVYSSAVTPSLITTVSQKVLFSCALSYNTWQDTGVAVTLNQGKYLVNINADGTITVWDQPSGLNTHGIWMCLMKNGTDLVQHEILLVGHTQDYFDNFTSTSSNGGLSLIVPVAADGTVYKVMARVLYTTGWTTLQMNLRNIDINAIKIG